MVQINQRGEVFSATRIVGFVLLFGLAGCQESPPAALGVLASDRIELVADMAEPILEILVTEGEHIVKGQALVVLDTSRINAQLAMADSEVGRLKALLVEQKNGPRAQQIAIARARVVASTLERDQAELTWKRQERLNASGLGVADELDRTRIGLELRESQLSATNDSLSELLAGTRTEQIEQTVQQLQKAKAQVSLLEVDRERLELKSAAEGVVDSLPFEVGEVPRKGDVLAVILMGGQPLARVYVPEQLRLAMSPGDEVSIAIDGMEQEITGRVRNISSNASFTPYYALVESDRRRLSYVAEITLPEMLERLPDGLPIELRLGSE